VTWDFDGNPATTADAGFEQCAGYFALDTTVSNNLGGGSKYAGIKGDAFYAAETEAIRRGVTPRYASSLPPATPDLLQALGVLGLATTTSRTRPACSKRCRGPATSIPPSG
jgi:hypothetical protein